MIFVPNFLHFIAIMFYSSSPNKHPYLLESLSTSDDWIKVRSGWLLKWWQKIRPKILMKRSRDIGTILVMNLLFLKSQNKPNGAFSVLEKRLSLDLPSYALPNYQELLLTIILRKIADFIYFEVRKSERSPSSLDSSQLIGQIYVTMIAYYGPKLY